MVHGDAREGKWRGNWRMQWVASTLHTTSEHGVSSITTAHAHTSTASSRLNWRPRRFKWTHPFRRKKKSSFCACAITFQTQSTTPVYEAHSVVCFPQYARPPSHTYFCLQCPQNGQYLTGRYCYIAVQADDPRHFRLLAADLTEPYAWRRYVRPSLCT